MALMSDAATAQAEAADPDPDRVAPARLDPAGTGKARRLLQTLIAYGKNLVETLRQNDEPELFPWYPVLTRIFGTTNPALITVIVIRGLLRATALQARFSKTTPLLPLPSRDWAEKQTNAGGRGPREAGGRAPGPRQPRAAGWVIPPGWPAGDTSRDRQPSPEQEMFAEIVAQDRDRATPAILLDVCLDLGIVSALTDPATRDEFVHNLTLYGGDPAPLISRSEFVQNSADPATLAAVSEAHDAAGPPPSLLSATSSSRPPMAGAP